MIHAAVQHTQKRARIFKVLRSTQTFLLVHEASLYLPHAQPKGGSKGEETFPWALENALTLKLTMLCCYNSILVLSFVVCVSLSTYLICAWHFQGHNSDSVARAKRFIYLSVYTSRLSSRKAAERDTKPDRITSVTVITATEISLSTHSSASAGL